MSDADLNSNKSASEPDWLATAWAPPKGDPARRALSESASNAKKLWQEWAHKAMTAIATADTEALNELKASGFFPERGVNPPKRHEGWFMSAFLINGMKSLTALVSVFPHLADQTPTLAQVFEISERQKLDLRRWEEAMAYLPNARDPWREFVSYGQSSPSFMVDAGFKIARRGLKSGWLSQEGLNAGKQPMGVAIAVLCVKRILFSNARSQGGVDDAFALLKEIHAASRAHGAARPRSQDLDMALKKILGSALTVGHAVESLQPAFDLIDLQWEKSVSSITARSIADASVKTPLNATAQQTAALNALASSYVGFMIRSQKPEAIRLLASKGLLDDSPILSWGQVENPLMARWHWKQATAKAGRPVDMSKRFESIREKIETSDAADENKQLWLSWLDADPTEAPAEARINLPSRKALSAGALAIALVDNWNDAAPFCQALVDAGVDLNRALAQAASFANPTEMKRAMSRPWLGALLERQALSASTSASAKLAAPKIRM